MRDCNNQHGLGFEKVDNAKGKAPKHYPASAHEVWTAVLRKRGNAPTARSTAAMKS